MRYDLKSYKELHCDNIDIIAEKSLKFIEETVGLDKQEIPWVFLNTKEVLNSVPEFLVYFKQYKLLPRDCACTILHDTLSIHIDTLPIIAKMNFPILNTTGWINRWYTANDKILNSLPTKKDPLGFDVPDVSSIRKENLEIVSELKDFKTPIILNSRQLHSVEKINALNVPRIMLTFTFFNDPWELLI